MIHCAPIRGPHLFAILLPVCAVKRELEACGKQKVGVGSGRAEAGQTEDLEIIALKITSTAI